MGTSGSTTSEPDSGTGTGGPRGGPAERAAGAAGAAGADRADELRHDWCARVAADDTLVAEAHAIIGDGGVDARALAARALVLAGAAASGPLSGAAASAAAGEATQSARARALDPASLAGLFGHLQDALAAWLMRHAAEASRADGTLSAGRAASCAATARQAVAALAGAVAVPAGEGEGGDGAAAAGADGGELARVLRHDIKSPLQAASLNLELLALESAEKGLDAGELEVIGQSIEQAIDMLRRFDDSGG